MFGNSFPTHLFFENGETMIKQGNNKSLFSFFVSSCFILLVSVFRFYYCFLPKLKIV